MEQVQDSARQALRVSKRFTKQVAPYAPYITRGLFVATFVEDGVRVLTEMPHQIDFLHYEYRIPEWLAGVLLVVTVLLSFVGSGLLIAQKHAFGGKYEALGSYLLLGCVAYQQVVYGRHSPIGSGNIGFLVRNLCLAGALLLFLAQSRIEEGRTALPGVPDPGNSVTMQSYLKLASRVLLVLLAMEFLTTMGWVGCVLTAPVVLAVAVGWYMTISGTLLLVLYLVHNVLNSAFWSLGDSYMKDVLRYEWVQTISIMGGLLMLVVNGPGELSVDERMRPRRPPSSLCRALVR